MPTLLLEGGFKFRVFLRDHNPPHIHVVKGKATVVISLGDNKTRPRIHQNYGMQPRDIRKALKITAENQNTFLTQWRKYHGKQ